MLAIVSLSAVFLYQAHSSVFRKVEYDQQGNETDANSLGREHATSLFFP